MEINLVYLVNAGNDAGQSSIANDHSFPALGVLALGTWLRQNLQDVEVIARDGQVVANDEIKSEIETLKPSVVGVSVLSTSYRNALEIAHAANGVGAKVVFGNDQASQLARRILDYNRGEKLEGEKCPRPVVDFVIGGEYGEKSLELLISSLRGEKIDMEKIPDLAYRENGMSRGFDYERDKGLLSIVSSPLYMAKSRKDALDIFPTVERNLYPLSHWSAYLQNYMSRFSGMHQGEIVTGVTTMNRARGCSRAKDPCNFCDLKLDISFSSPKRFWQEVEDAHRQIGANIFYEVCDSFSSFPRFIDDLIKSMPNLGFEPKFFVYAQAIDLVRNTKLVSKLKNMGVFRVNIGLESGSDVTIRHMKGKYDSVDNNYRALQMLNDAGIHVYGSFVLGSDAETYGTLRETVAWAKKIMGEGLIADIEAQPLLPLPQNMQGKKLVQSGLLSQRIMNTDWPWNTDIISQTYINNFSGVGYKDTLNAANEIRDFAKKHRINYGSGVSLTRNYSQ